MIKREKYLSRIKPFINKPIIKVITGVRRSGKSILLKLLIAELKDLQINEQNILYINKDSLEFDFIRNYDDLYKYAKEKLKQIKGTKYLFIDEIQEITEWEKAVASFFADDFADIYITGSNAQLLSSELATLLSGRYIEFKINTLVFSEFLNFRKKSVDNKEDEFALFLKYGGFPGIHQIDFTNDVISQYLNSLYNTILLKDVVSRNQIRDVALLENIIKYVTDNCGNITTAKGISDYIKSQQIKSSVDTIQNYLLWLSNAYFTYKVNRYDIKGKKYLELYEKYYLSDIGLLFSIFGNRVNDISGKLENIVFLELLSRGYKVSIGKVNNLEVDFIAEKNDDKVYIQVTYLLSDAKVISREFDVLKSINNNYKKIVLSLDKYLGKEIDGILWYNLIDFLLDENLI